MTEDAFIRHWASRFGVPHEHCDAGTYRYWNLGEVPPLAQPLDEETARALHGDVDALLKARYAGLKSMLLLQKLSSAFRVLGDSRGETFVGRLARYVDAAIDGAQVSIDGKGSTGGDWFDEE